VYSVDRICGGPEEGGWWYDSGNPIRSYPVPNMKIAKILREKLSLRFPTTRKRYSVLGGEDYEVWIEEHRAEPWPQYTPRYE